MINLTQNWNMIPDIFQIFLYIHITYNSNYYILEIDILRYTYSILYTIRIYIIYII